MKVGISEIEKWPYWELELNPSNWGRKVELTDEEFVSVSKAIIDFEACQDLLKKKYEEAKLA